MHQPSRRTFLQGGSLGLAALATGLLPARGEAASSSLVVADPGGDWQAAANAAFYAPFEQETGIPVRFGPRRSQPPDQPFLQLSNMEEAGNVRWDVAVLPEYLIDRAGKAGLLQPIDYDRMSTDGMAEEALTTYGVGLGAYASIMAYSTQKWPAGEGPRSWADFWDVTRFPGRRAMSGIGYGPLEFALLADGVPAEKLYPLDIGRALSKMSEIKPHIAVWWRSGAEQERLMREGAVDLIQGGNDRLCAAIAGGARFHPEWNQGMYQWEGWAIPKGALHAGEAAKLIAFSITPKQQAIFAETIAFGPSNQDALATIPAERQRALPTDPANLRKMFPADAESLLKNLDALMLAWTKWRASCLWRGSAC